MKIEFYISQLLYRYQCVTVPGFGAFLAETHSAQLQEVSHSFYPPRKVISFNGLLKNNDGLLANHVAVSEKIPYEEALHIIEKDVALLKESLSENKRVFLKNIGELSLNSEGNLVFIAVETVNYLTTSFGLTSFVSPSIKRIFYSEKIDDIEELIPASFVTERKNRIIPVKYAAALFVGFGLVLGGVWAKNEYEKRIEEQTLLVQAAVQKKVNQKIQEATFFIENPLSSISATSVKEEKMPYHIVAGSFRKESNARVVYKELIRLGYKAKILPQNERGLFPVFYQSFSNATEAETKLKEIRKNHNPEAWVMVKEL